MVERGFFYYGNSKENAVGQMAVPCLHRQGRKRQAAVQIIHGRQQERGRVSGDFVSDEQAV